MLLLYMAAIHNNKHRISVRRDTAQVDYANQEHTARMLAYIFLVAYHIEFENIFPETFLSETDGKI